MTLLQLLNDSRRGDPAAQRRLYDRFATPMFLVCRRYLKTDAWAEEAVMGGFLKFFRSLDGFTYQSDEATAAWLRRIMVTECLMALRARDSFLVVAEELPDTGAGPDPLDRLGAEEIFTLITRLPTGYRTVFNLYEVEGYSHKEIAAALGISEATSRSQLHKAKQLLQQSFIQNNPEHAWRKTS